MDLWGRGSLGWVVDPQVRAFARIPTLGAMKPRRRWAPGFVATWLFCGGREDGGGAVEGFGEAGKLGLGAGGVRGVDGLVDAGDDYGGVAGELAGGVDGVLEPGTPGEAFGVEQSLFGRAQGLVEIGWLGRCGELKGMNGDAGVGEAPGGGEGGGEVEFQIRGGGTLLGGLEVAENLLAVELIVVGEDVGVGHVQDLEAEDASLLLLVDEGGVGEFDEPVVVVEDGVIDAVGALGADVGRGDAEVLDAGGVVGAGAEAANVHIVLDVGVEAGGAAGGAGVAAALIGCLLGLLPLIVHGSALGAGNFFCYLSDELLERGHGSGAGVWPGDTDCGC